MALRRIGDGACRGHAGDTQPFWRLAHGARGWSACRWIDSATPAAALGWPISQRSSLRAQVRLGKERLVNVAASRADHQADGPGSHQERRRSRPADDHPGRPHGGWGLGEAVAATVAYAGPSGRMLPIGLPDEFLVDGALPTCTTGTVCPPRRWLPGSKKSWTAAGTVLSGGSSGRRPNRAARMPDRSLPRSVRCRKRRRTTAAPHRAGASGCRMAGSW